ncbi:hypothetical protein J7F02_28270 [Streptomyces sp. ISL-112]|uniref:hypothetical protein n=1 Tax=unclassified Streptomyces TaxID=2593676 RepID=UPI001BE82590|nr:MULTISPECIES: hypothetical protein [unclassified Streptomyces]MBT2429406.1 hypothetical protein [Streptomyces sp. ISL-112]MBT2463998.1 hypothetical protein [Streptomyces sp. ISL-63]
MNDNIVAFSLDNYNLPPITVELVDVTPELAQHWLLKNVKNRNLRKGIVSQYGRDMIAREWTINGSTIVFADDGTLIDGQHRLNAIAACDVPGISFPTLVVRGVAERVKRTIDGGSKRTMSDRLKIDDTQSSPTILASLLRRAHMWDKGVYVNVGGTPPSAAEMYAYLENNPGVLWSSEFAGSARRRILAPASVVAIAHWVTSRLDADAAKWFFEQLIEPTELPSGHAVHALNKKLTAEATRIGRANETELLAAFVIAWNAYRAGRTITQIRIPRGDNGLKNSTFPLPK